MMSARGQEPDAGPRNRVDETNRAGGSLTIDAHAHVLLPDVDALVAGHPRLAAQRELELRRVGRESMAELLQVVNDRMPQLTDIGVRLADMDAAEVDIQIVSPSPSHYHYWADQQLAAKLCAHANADTASYCALQPDRLRGMGQVPLQHPELAAELLTEAVSAHGLLGVQIGSHAEGTDLSDRRLDVLWAKAEELGAVIFLHPISCPIEDRLARWYLSNLVGQLVEHAVAISHLIFGGVFDRFPGLKTLAAHGGGYLPTGVARADHGWQVRSDTRGCQRIPSSYLRSMWFDSLVYEPRPLQNLFAAVGSDRVVMGTDYPFDMGVTDPVGRLTVADLSEEVRAAVRGLNAAKLFGLASSADEARQLLG